MAECPLPKPNTRVRFPSPAPKRKTYAPRRAFFLEQTTVLRNRARNALAANLRSKFAARFEESSLGSDSRRRLSKEPSRNSVRAFLSR